MCVVCVNTLLTNMFFLHNCVYGPFSIYDRCILTVLRMYLFSLIRSWRNTRSHYTLHFFLFQRLSDIAPCLTPITGLSNFTKDQLIPHLPLITRHHPTSHLSLITRHHPTSRFSLFTTFFLLPLIARCPLVLSLSLPTNLHHTLFSI